jgi:hemolysin D
VAAIRETRGQAVAEYRHTLSDEFAKAEQKANGLTQDLIKAEQKTKLQLLTALVDRHPRLATRPLRRPQAGHAA